MIYQLSIDNLPSKLKELRDNIESQRYAESVSAAEMYQARAMLNVEEIEAAITVKE